MIAGLRCRLLGHRTIMIIDEVDPIEFDLYGLRGEVKRKHYQCHRCMRTVPKQGKPAKLTRASATWFKEHYRA